MQIKQLMTVAASKLICYTHAKGYIYEKQCNADQKSKARCVNKYHCYKIMYFLNMHILHRNCLRYIYDIDILTKMCFVTT